MRGVPAHAAARQFDLSQQILIVILALHEGVALIQSHGWH
jgi:hypothetical protein